jgi:phospholipase C
MTKRKKVSHIAGLAVSLILIALAGCQGIVTHPTNPNGTLQNSVNHIIFFMQENRSFDSYFAKLDDFRANIGQPRNVDDLESMFSVPADDGTMVSNFHLTTSCIFNTSAAWQESWGDMNRFDTTGPLLLDGFVHTAGVQAQRDGVADTKGVRAMGFYTGDDLTAPYFLAAQFATSDRFYAPAPVQTEVVRLWSMAATSQGFVHPPADNSGFLNATTIFQLLDKANISWKIYSVDIGGDGKLITSLRKFLPYGLTQESRIVPIDDFFTDLKNGTLPQFAYIEPSFITGLDEHPGEGTKIWAGAEFAAHLVQSLMESTSWKDSIFIETFDEGGGLFDHVSPMIDGQPILALTLGQTGQALGAAAYSSDGATQHVPSPDGIPPRDLNPDDPHGDFTRTGFRVPLIVVSPFAKSHFVSHTPMDYTAVLKLIETRFGLPNLTARDAVQPDMTEFFDFVNIPNFLPLFPPRQPTSQVCDATQASAPVGPVPPPTPAPPTGP